MVREILNSAAASSTVSTEVWVAGAEACCATRAERARNVAGQLGAAKLEFARPVGDLGGQFATADQAQKSHVFVHNRYEGGDFAAPRTGRSRSRPASAEDLPTAPNCHHRFGPPPTEEQTPRSAVGARVSGSMT